MHRRSILVLHMYDWADVRHILSSDCEMYFQVGVRGEKTFESDYTWGKNVPGKENEIIYDMWPYNNKELSSHVFSKEIVIRVKAILLSPLLLLHSSAHRCGTSTSRVLRMSFCSAQFTLVFFRGLLKCRLLSPHPRGSGSRAQKSEF